MQPSEAPDISVIIPTFNYGHWLPDAITSVLSQEGVSPRLIVVDDGSTDATPEIVRAFPDVEYVPRPHAGASAARNAGLDRVGTGMVCFLDADDTLPTNFLRTLADVLEHEPEAAFAYTGINYRGTDTRQFPARPWSVEDLKRDNFISPTSLFRMGAIGDLRFDTRLRCWEDWDFMLALAERGLRGVPVAGCAFDCLKHADRPSTFDRFGHDRLLRARARRHVARKHRALYGVRERVRAEIVVPVVYLMSL